MSPASLARLLLLSAIWGASFIFMRVAVPALGPAALMALRVLLAALFLAAVAGLRRQPLDLRRNARHYLALGLVNSALPFLLFGFAARTLPASLLAILNATSPLWGALVGAAWTRTRPAPRTLFGLGCGILGVALLVGLDPTMLRPGAGLAAAAALAASGCYGLASQYAKQARAVEPFANAHGSMWGALLWLLPAALLFPPAAAPGGPILLAVAILGVVCTGVAYLLYFRLIRDIGAAPALTVTFLIPLFGVLWGALFLDEAIGWHTLAGGCVVVLGTALVTARRRRPPPAAAG